MVKHQLVSFTFAIVSEASNCIVFPLIDFTNTVYAYHLAIKENILTLENTIIHMYILSNMGFKL